MITNQIFLSVGILVYLCALRKVSVKKQSDLHHWATLWWPPVPEVRNRKLPSQAPVDNDDVITRLNSHSAVAWSRKIRVTFLINCMNLSHKLNWVRHDYIIQIFFINEFLIPHIHIFRALHEHKATNKTCFLLGHLIYAHTLDLTKHTSIVY